jgi:two-component system nitrate/nitrite response regulator NarL
MITVLLVDDHISVLKSLRFMLEATEDIQVVATASNGMEAIAQARQHCPDVAVVDISMPLMDGIEAARQISDICRFTRVMMLSILDNPEYVQRALDVGAVGFILKDTIAKDLLAGIRTVSAGKRYFSHKIAEIVERYTNKRGKDSWAG